MSEPTAPDVGTPGQPDAGGARTGDRAAPPRGLGGPSAGVTVHR